MSEYYVDLYELVQDEFPSLSFDNLMQKIMNLSTNKDFPHPNSSDADKFDYLVEHINVMR